MQAKTMIQAIAATLILTVATSWGNMIWTFDSGAEGWLMQGGASADITPAGEWPGHATSIKQTGSWNTVALYITGLNQTVSGSSDFIRFTTFLSDGSGAHSPYDFTLTTANGTYGYQLTGENNGTYPTTTKQLNLFTDLTAQGASPALAVGDIITGLRVSSYVANATTYLDDVTLAVPEPASLALLALGGCCLLRRRR